MVGVCDVFVEIKLLSQQNEQFNKSVQNWQVMTDIWFIYGNKKVYIH